MKPQGTRPEHERYSEPPRRRRDLDTLGLATLAGVVAILMITYANMRDIDRIDRGIGERLSRLEGQIARGGTAAPQPSSGPDPNRIYTIKLAADAPIRGPASAPVTIAEFSDFQ